MMILTFPFVLPALKVMGFDLIVFGVVLNLLLEAALLTPPLGINLFVLQGVTGTRFETVLRGSMPFFLLMLVCLTLVLLFPQLALWIPNRMYIR